MRHRLASLALAASTLLAGCRIGFGDGENAVPPVWTYAPAIASRT